MTGQRDPAAVLSQLGRLVVRISPRDMSLTAGGTLANLRDRGPRRISALAESEGVAQPSMTELVNRLVRDGLVARAPDPADGRAVTVALTEAGAAAVDRRRRDRDQALAALVAELPAADRRRLDAALPVLEKIVAAGLR